MLVEIKRQASLISVRTGLKEDTCVDLLLSGWSFKQNTNGEPDQWISSQGSVSLPKK